MSSSSDLRPADPPRMATPELRPGRWTRLGDHAVHGDEVTERLLDSLAERAERAARAQGYATGWAEGRRKGEAATRATAEQTRLRADAEEARRESEHEAALAALRAAAEGLQSRVDDICARVDEQAVTLALELTHELVGRATPDREHVVRRVLEQLRQQPVARVRLHPAVAAHADEVAAQGVEVVADPSLAPADAVVEAEDHLVDLRVATALQRLREALS